MTTWPGCRMLAVDTETTGIDVFTDRIVTAYAGYVGGGEPVLSQGWLINPGVPIPESATAVHGVTDDMAAKGRPPAEAVDMLAAEITLAMGRGIPVVLANAPYDLSLIEAECRRHQLPTLTERLPVESWRVLDVQVLDKRAWPYRKGSRRLVDLAKTYAIDLAESDAHGAEADALTAARVAWRIGQAGAEKVARVLCDKPDVVNAYGTLARMSLDQVHAGQVEWHRTQATSLRKHFAGKGEKDRAASVSTEWPLRVKL